MRTRIIALLIFAVIGSSQALVTVSTAQYNNNRTGENSSEYVLTPANISRLKFLCSYSVDSAIFSEQPLYIPQVTVSGVVHNLLVVASSLNTVYAFDADVCGSPLWSINLGTARPSSGPTGYPFVIGEPIFYNLSVGVVSTPVIDPVGGYVYVAANVVTGTPAAPQVILCQINLITGALVNSVIIAGQVTGTGDQSGSVADPTSGPNLLFFPNYELQRLPLTLANGNVYVGFSSWSDQHPWHGWLFAYNASTLSQVAVWCTSPNSFGGGIWESGGGAADGGGDIYVVTGNGTYDGSTAFSMSVVKLSSTLSLLDWWTPTNYAALSAVDADVSSGRAILIPGTSLLTVGSKDFNVELIDTSSMGHVSVPVQEFPTGSGTVSNVTGIFGGAFCNNNGYFPNTNGKLYGFSFSGSTYNTTPVTTSATYAFPGPALACSDANGSNVIVWGVTSVSSSFDTQQAGVLRAWNPSTLVEYWNSGSSLGHVSKFSSPTIATGRVYVATVDSKIQVYGLGSSGGGGGSASGNQIGN